MLSKKLALGFGIAILLPLLVYYGVSSFSPPPRWNDYFIDDRVTSGNLPSTPEEIAKAKDENRRRTQQFTDHERRFAKHVFFVATPVGIAAILLGATFTIEAIGTGLMFGGIFTVVEGYFSYWNELEYWMRFLSLIAAFGVLLFIGIRKFGPQQRK